MPTLDFWYEFASTYCYPAAMRIEKHAAACKVAVRWRPFLLGPIFDRQGWTTSPFNLYRAKGQNMFRDLERICAKEGLPFRRPDPFPQNSLLAARIALALDDDKRPAFSRAVYVREFAEGLPVDDRDALAKILADQAIDPGLMLAAAASPAIKDRLRAAGAEAERLGLYGAPSFVTSGGELFWGNDRLDDALAWALSESD
jgi:2-hydroxychromene-2-carboxylate isomerase